MRKLTTLLAVLLMVSSSTMAQFNFDFSDILQKQPSVQTQPTEGKIYEGSFTTTGTKLIPQTNQLVNIPTMSVYARIYGDRIEVTADGNVVVKPFWKFENNNYYYGQENNFWSFCVSPSISLAEATPNSIILLCRTCYSCNGGKYCISCKGAGLYIDAGGKQRLCSYCGGGGFCETCYGKGYY